MIFGLVTFAKVKLHPSLSTIRSAIHQAMTCLIFVHEAACGCEVLTNLYCGYSMMKIKITNILSYM